MNKKIVLGVVIVIVVILFGYCIANTKEKNGNPTTQSQGVSNSTSMSVEWTTYKNEDYEYTVDYPTTAKVDDKAPGSVTFYLGDAFDLKYKLPTAPAGDSDMAGGKERFNFRIVSGRIIKI